MVLTYTSHCFLSFEKSLQGYVYQAQYYCFSLIQLHCFLYNLQHFLSILQVLYLIGVALTPMHLQQLFNFSINDFYKQTSLWCNATVNFLMPNKRVALYKNTTLFTFNIGILIFYSLVRDFDSGDQQDCRIHRYC